MTLVQFTSENETWASSEMSSLVMIHPEFGIRFPEHIVEVDHGQFEIFDPSSDGSISCGIGSLMVVTGTPFNMWLVLPHLKRELDNGGLKRIWTWSEIAGLWFTDLHGVNPFGASVVVTTHKTWLI